MIYVRKIFYFKIFSFEKLKYRVVTFYYFYFLVLAPSFLPLSLKIYFSFTPEILAMPLGMRMASKSQILRCDRAEKFKYDFPCRIYEYFNVVSNGFRKANFVSALTDELVSVKKNPSKNIGRHSISNNLPSLQLQYSSVRDWYSN